MSGKISNIDKHRHEMYVRMMSDYFAQELDYDPNLYRRHYRIKKSLFLTLLDRVFARDDYFVLKTDAYACGF